MRKLLIFLGVLVVGISMTQMANAALINGGFETGNLTGWTAFGNADVVTSFTVVNDGPVTGASNGEVYTPVEGEFFSRLIGEESGVYQTLTQQFTGSNIEGWAAFIANDYLPFDDEAYVKILDLSGAVLETPWYSSVTNVGDYGFTQWTHWQSTQLTQGTYLIQYGVKNIGDGGWKSVGLFDTATSNAVPEPASLSLLGMGLLGLLGLKKRKVY